MTQVTGDELSSLDIFAGIPAKDLVPLAARLKPLRAAPGEVIMRQGERGRSFAIIASGRAEVRHVGSNGHVTVAELPPGLIVGEMALLRNAPRTATVTAKDDLRGYVGFDDAFECMLANPLIGERMVRTARQRLAAFITPIPVRVKDGTELLLRPALPGDAERFVEGSSAFSRETIYNRFLSVSGLSEARLAYLFEVDYVNHFAWVITGTADGPVAADARFVRDADNAGSAEIALTVADAYQRRGVGTLLLAALAIAAHTDGIEVFHAVVLAENPAARALGDKFHAQWEVIEPGVIATTMMIPALDELPLTPEVRQQIQQVAYQVIHAFAERPRDRDSDEAGESSQA